MFDSLTPCRNPVIESPNDKKTGKPSRTATLPPTRHVDYSEMNPEDLLSEIESLHSRVAELEAVELRLRNLEKALRESSERFRLFYELVPLPYQSLDQNLIRDCLEQILASRCYRVITAGNGAEALEIYREKKDEIDLVILDLIMPGMAGLDFLDAIFKIDPAATALIASGYSVDESTKRSLKACEFIRKPFDAREIFQTIRRILNQTDSPKHLVRG
jgi:CheY-like chemotaxis protein